MLTTSSQLRAARALIGWQQSLLAGRSGVAVNTIRRMEEGNGLIRANLSTVQKAQAALEAEGVVFIPENGGGPGVRLKASASE